ncbi:hypothetical protein [Streptomyces goshikiensis]|uniref:hypothetical protein n=1 Tax=Streptomyces goshikiensis TaxID=1942 RepID=UPI00371EEA90
MLDVRRVGKQRVEAVQVLRGLVVPGYGWPRHPAVRVWAGKHSSGTGPDLRGVAAWERPTDAGAVGPPTGT